MDLRLHLRALRVLAVLSALLLAGCGAAMPDEEVDEAEIEAVIRAYLPAISAAYKEGNVVELKKIAVPKEVARVRLRRDELEQRGQVFEPEFKNLTVEKIRVWKYSNAFVTTVEVWDIRSYALGSHTLLQEVVDQRSRVTYQLKRKDDGWKILYRELIENLDE